MDVKEDKLNIEKVVQQRNDRQNIKIVFFEKIEMILLLC